VENRAAWLTAVWASCHNHQPRHVAVRWWHYSCGSAHHKLSIGHTAFSQQWKCNGNYWRVGIFEGMRKMGSLKSHNRAQTSKESHLFRIVGVYWCWWGGIFVLDRHRWQNLGLPLWARDEKAVNGVASSAITKTKEVQDNSFHQKGHDHHLLNTNGVILVDVMDRGETVSSEVYITTLQKLKQSYRRVQPNRNPGNMLIQYDSACPHNSANPGGNHQIWLDCSPPSPL
jgi:hypothetical protein